MIHDAAQTPVPDLKQLRYFLAVCDAGSISSAAIALGIGQATLSENIAKLEKRLGVTLLVRGSRGVLLTESGGILSQKGRHLLDAAQDLARAVAQGGLPSGAVALGLPPSLSVLAGIPLAETIRSEHRDIQLRISEALSGHILDWLGEGRLDLGYVYEPPNMDVFDAVSVFREDLFLIAAADFIPVAAKVGDERSISVEAVGRLPFVLPSPKHNARRILDRMFRVRSITPDIISEIDSHSQIVEMLARASAYTILPKAAVLRELNSGALVALRISGAPLVRTCYCVRRRSQPISAANLLIQHVMLDILRELSQRHGLALDFLN